MITKGKIYAGQLRWWHRKIKPLMEVGHTQETEGRFRVGKCLVVRIPFTYKAVYIGKWGNSGVLNAEDDDAVDSLLREAMRARSHWSAKEGPYSEFFQD